MSDLLFDNLDKLLDGGEGVGGFLWLLEKSRIGSWTIMFRGGVTVSENVHGDFEAFFIEIRWKHFLCNGFDAFSKVQQCINQVVGILVYMAVVKGNGFEDDVRYGPAYGNEFRDSVTMQALAVNKNS